MSKTSQSNCCPMDSILRLIMGPWTTYILWLLHTHDALRFGQLKKQMNGISAKVLTDRLRMLEGAGLVHRDYKPTVPPTVTYSLTARGNELRDVLSGIHHLAEKWDAEDAATKIASAAE